MPAPAALITGGTSGIGLATAGLLHERGFQVMVTGQNPDTLAAAGQELADDIVILEADSRSLTDSDRIAEEVWIRFGQLTTLFLNAGIARRVPVPSVDETTYDELFAINTKGQFFTLQKTLPLLAEGASIVFTVGVGVTRGGPAAASPQAAGVPSWRWCPRWPPNWHHAGSGSTP
jgi:NAD(P)-dependent dehydrogenase (short-subunit alcohol dehydrogenase family)